MKGASSQPDSQPIPQPDPTTRPRANALTRPLSLRPTLNFNIPPPFIRTTPPPQVTRFADFVCDDVVAEGAVLTDDGFVTADDSDSTSSGGEVSAVKVVKV